MLVDFTGDTDTKAHVICVNYTFGLRYKDISPSSDTFFISKYGKYDFVDATTDSNT